MAGGDQVVNKEELQLGPALGACAWQLILSGISNFHGAVYSVTECDS